jgi:D-alanyl-D-alanine dipeptidase
MNAKEYCDLIEAQDVENIRLRKNFLVKENGSPLVSLKKVGLNLIYEPTVYKGYRYMVREELVEKIARITEKLEQQNRRLVIRSAWRSFAHQKMLWDNTVALMKRRHPQKTLARIHEIVANYVLPEKKSTHSTGGAIDALIYDKKSDRILDFGTNEGYDIRLGRKCYPHHPEISAEAKENRSLLISLFEQEDFVCDTKEYWHFDYGNIGWALRKGKDHAIYGILEKG